MLICPWSSIEGGEGSAFSLVELSSPLVAATLDRFRALPSNQFGRPSSRLTLHLLTAIEPSRPDLKPFSRMNTTCNEQGLVAAGCWSWSYNERVQHTALPPPLVRLQTTRTHCTNMSPDGLARDATGESSRLPFTVG